MARARGNPGFGSKYRFHPIGVETLSEYVGAKVTPATKQKLESKALESDRTVPQVIRDAIAYYLERETEIPPVKPYSEG